MLRDRFTAPETSTPWRPLYPVPARAGGVPIGTSWYKPRGIRMYHRVKVSRGSTVIIPFPAWSAATEGIWTGNGTVAGRAGGTETVTVDLEIGGRVVPYDHVYTIRKVSSMGVITTEEHTLNVTAPGAYTISWTAASSGTAQMDLTGSKFQFNLPT